MLTSPRRSSSSSSNPNGSFLLLVFFFWLNSSSQTGNVPRRLSACETSSKTSPLARDGGGLEELLLGVSPGTEDNEMTDADDEGGAGALRSGDEEADI